MSTPPVPDHIDLLAASAGAVAVADARWRFRYVSEQYAALAGRQAEAMIGRSVWEIFPEAVGTPRYDEAVAAVRAGGRAETLWRDVQSGRWLEQQVLPSGEDIVLVNHDVTDHQEALERSRSLLAISQALTGALTQSEVAIAASSRACGPLGASGGVVVLRGTGDQPLVSLPWPGMSTEVSRRWDRLLALPDNPIAEVIRTGRAVVAERLADISERWPEVAAELAALSRHALAVLPLTAGQRLVGVLALHFDNPRRFTPAEHDFLETVAGITGQALRRAQLVEREHAGSEAMQRALLPHSLPQLAQVEIAARYRPGGQSVEVGGDWFDVIDLGGAFAVVMGDVEGHDLAAAATMGQVRSAVRSYALLGHPPALVVHETNQFVASLGLERIVTLFYAQVHPQEHLVTAVSAGHPVPLLARGEEVTELELPVGPPLGVPEGSWAERSSLLEPGARMLVFTDGLLERRDSAQEKEGSAVVRRVLARESAASAEELVDAVLAAVALRGPFGDDVAVLALRLTEPAAPLPRRLRRRLPASAVGASVARRFVRDVLGEWGLTEVQDTAELLASELLGNAARHSDEFIELWLDVGADALTVSVFDRSHRLPVLREVAPEESSGRGLMLVEALADAWGVEEQIGGKTVWFRLALDPAAGGG